MTARGAGTSDVRVALVRIELIDAHPTNVRRDLGDLRDLAQSIREHGVMQPVVLERRGARFRVRAGHRRVAAAALAGVVKVPAVIHPRSLDDDEWLVQAAHENTRRKDLDRADRAHTVRAMRAAGMRWEAIAAAFAVSEATARGYLAPEERGPTDRVESLAERREQILLASAQGLSAGQIADRVGLSAREVVRIRNGLVGDGSRHGGARPRPIHRALVRDVIERYEDRPGATAGEVIADLRALLGENA